MGFKSLKPEAKTQVNRFSLTVGTSGNTTYILGQTFPAGDYTIEFSNGDTTYDIYAIGTDGTNVGYTNGVKLTANADINEIVVLGAADNEVITFENFTFSVVGGGDPVAPSSAGDVASAGAFITSVSVSSLPNADDTTTITGGNFAADVQVFFTGQDSVELEAKSLTRNSSTELVATRPDALDATDSPYTVKVVNPGVSEPTGSSAHLLPNSITAGANPSWVTAAAQIYNIGVANTITLVATDADGTVSYSLQSGTLPGGLSLNGSTGEISGTPTTSDGDVNVFTIRATDEGGNFVDREFTFTAVGPLEVEYLVIAGGGGGGIGYYGGGGGAGGYRSSVVGESSGGGASAESVLTLDPATNYTVTVGAGGAGETVKDVTPAADNGSDSVFASITSFGGGGGGNRDGGNGADGGSGGGTAEPAFEPGSGTAGQGYRGGLTQNGGYLNNDYGSGGGGAGEVGGDGSRPSPYGGPGGDGVSSSIIGSATFRAGGGAGGSNYGSGFSGGSGGGGSSPGGANGNPGSANTGGGGGAGGQDLNLGGNGGSGVVILRYPAAYSLTIGAGLTGTTSTVGANKVTEITAGTGNVSFS